MNIGQWLVERGVLFERMHHYRSFDGAAISGIVAIAEQPVAKTVMLRADDSMVLTVLPETHLIDLGRVRQILLAELVELVSERQFNNWLPECEIGAVPPFGRRYGITTLVDAELMENDDIVFEGSTPEESIRMAVDDFQALESPIVASFSYHV